MNNLKSAHIFLKIVAISAAISMVISSLSVYLFDLQTKSYASIVDLPISRVFTSNQINLSQKAYDLPLIRGIEVDSKNPENIQFYFDTMNSKSVSNKEMNRMIKYFLGFLAIPEEKLWVNLSPYEKDRVLPDSLAKLDIGKDLLLEDYFLKQLTASLTNPKTKEGKKFWQEVYQRAEEICGTKKVPINNFYKVWIVPDIAEIYEHSVGAGSKPALNKQNKTITFVKDARLKVMMETDYHNNVKQPGKGLISPVPNRHNLRIQKINAEAKEIFKKELLPIIQEQVNESVNFAPLRQMYYAWILATYLKGKIKSVGEGPCALPIQDYINSERADPISLFDAEKIKEKVYSAYLQKLKQGMYDETMSHLSRKERCSLSGKGNVRQYFSGGVTLTSGQGFKFHSFHSIAEMYCNFSGAIGYVKVKINEQKENENSFPIINMRTFSGRLAGSNQVIILWAERLKQELQEDIVVYDIGMGASANGPVTTIELAKGLEGKGSVLGMDIQTPHYQINLGKNRTFLFDEKDQLLQYVSNGSYYTQNTIPEEDRKYYWPLLKRIRQQSKGKDCIYQPSKIAFLQQWFFNFFHKSLMRFVRILNLLFFRHLPGKLFNKYLAFSMKILNNLMRYSIKLQIYLDKGYKIIHMPLKQYKKDNLSFYRADVLNLSKTLAQGSVPKAHIVRIGNLFFRHLPNRDISRALNELFPYMHENGICLIGHSGLHWMNFNEETFLVYRKKGHKFILEDYLFSTEVLSDGSVRFGRGPQAGEFLKEEGEFNLPSRVFVPFSWFPNDVRGTKDVVTLLARKISEQGFKAESLGKMIRVALKEPEIKQDESGALGVQQFFWQDFKRIFFDKGVPREVAVRKNKEFSSFGGIDLSKYVRKTGSKKALALERFVYLLGKDKVNLAEFLVKDGVGYSKDVSFIQEEELAQRRQYESEVALIVFFLMVRDLDHSFLREEGNVGEIFQGIRVGYDFSRALRSAYRDLNNVNFSEIEDWIVRLMKNKKVSAPLVERLISGWEKLTIQDLLDLTKEAGIENQEQLNATMFLYKTISSLRKDINFLTRKITGEPLLPEVKGEQSFNSLVGVFKIYSTLKYLFFNIPFSILNKEQKQIVSEKTEFLLDTFLKFTSSGKKKGMVEGLTKNIYFLNLFNTLHGRDVKGTENELANRKSIIPKYLESIFMKQFTLLDLVVKASTSALISVGLLFGPMSVSMPLLMILIYCCLFINFSSHKGYCFGKTFEDTVIFVDANRNEFFHGFMHEMVHRLYRNNYIATDLPVASMVETLIQYEQNLPFKNDHWQYGINLGQDLFQKYPDDPQKRWEALLKEFDAKVVRNHTNDLVDDPEAIVEYLKYGAKDWSQDSSKRELIWTYWLGAALAVVAQKLIEITREPNVSWEYVNLIAQGVSPVQAEKIVRKLINGAKEYCEIANVKYQYNDYEEAIGYFDLAIDADSNLAEAYFGRAHVYSELGQKDKYIVDLKQTIAVDPSYFLAHENLGFYYRENKDIGQALLYLQKASELIPGDYDVAEALVEIYLEQQQYDKAIEVYTKCKDALTEQNVIDLIEEKIKGLSAKISSPSSASKSFSSLGKVFARGNLVVRGKLASLFTRPGGIAFHSKFLNAPVKPTQKIPQNYQGISYEIVSVEGISRSQEFNFK